MEIRDMVRETSL